MNKLPNLLALVITTALLTVLSGCATPKQTEELLSRAGFKAVPATTPQQTDQLKTLRPHQITKVQRGGTQYFVYPDPAHNILYVGQSAQYEEYKKLRKSQQWAEEENNLAATNEWNFTVWGDW